MVTGLALSFTFATVALVYVINALGLPNGFARDLAIVVLFAFGISLLIPPIGDRVEAFASRLAPGPARFRGDGFGSGLVVGASLGLVYAPCAGPILAGVIVVSAAQDFTAGRLAVALSYAIGSAIVLYLLLLGGRRLTQRLKPVRGRVQMAMGAVMVLVAIAMTANLDVRFQTEIASALPRFLVNPTESIEKSKAISTPLAKVSQHGTPVVPADELNQPVSLQTYGQAPDFTGTQDWFNTPGGESLSMSDLRGKVVLVDFWTYTCINCIRTLPYLEAWQQRYGSQGFTVVGVHSPEFPFEKDAGERPGGDPAEPPDLSRSSRTTTWRPGTRGATSTGRPTTWWTPRATSATLISARATTPRPSERSGRCSERPATRSSARGPGRRRRRRRRARRLPRPTWARHARRAG